MRPESGWMKVEYRDEAPGHDDARRKQYPKFAPLAGASGAVLAAPGKGFPGPGNERQGDTPDRVDRRTMTHEQRQRIE